MGEKTFQKISSWVKGQSIYAKQKIVLKEIYNITIYYNISKVLEKFIYLGFVERPKFQIVIFFSNHGRDSLKALSLLKYLWSF